MPDPADRIRVEPKPAPARAKPAPLRRWARALAPKSKRSAAGAALVAMMIGIVVNAVALQHGRRLGLGPDPTVTASVKPPALVAKPGPSGAAADAAPTAPSRATPTAVALAHPPKSDAIADFLRANGADKRRLTLSAQRALAKMGFSVKPTGALDAQTRSALLEFEKSRRLPVSTEITAKLADSLVAAAAAN